MGQARRPVANIAINLILIPIAGPLGAAWANLISQVMIAMALLTRWVLLPNQSPLWFARVRHHDQWNYGMTSSLKHSCDISQ